ncbi:hypothetical protein B0H13DRAFT_1890721 [Mycena leptocephala]|nr:hypothetical protein B0H13DRAFT_1890721 [Mycena leptocephala]
MQAIADAKAPETIKPASMKQWAVKLSKAHLTASSQSVSATAIKANATNDDDQNETSFQRPPIIEREKVNILQLPIADIQHTVLEYLVQPILVAREYAQYLISEEEGFHAQVGAAYYPEYKNTQTARSNVANGHGKNANANKSESDEKEAEAQRVDRVGEAEWIIQVVLVDYLKTVEEVELTGGWKLPDWDSLGLDSVEQLINMRV